MDHPGGQHGEETELGPALGRVYLFSDAVFAIAITLIVLGFDLPHGMTLEEVPQRLYEQLPDFLSFAFGFWILSFFWITHHRMFRYIDRLNHGLLVWNLIVLLCVAFLPFPIVTVGDYPGSAPAVILFAAAQAAAALTCLEMWSFAAREKLIRATTDPRVIRHLQVRLFSVGIVFLASIPVAVVYTPAAFVMWPVVLIIFYIVDRRTPAAARF
ncbi:MAG TPA: TMEM175 family protein [bacterium]